MKAHAGTGILDCLAHFDIPHCVDKATKKRITNAIVTDRGYPSRCPEELEWYNRSDGAALMALAEKFYPKTDAALADALAYGEYAKALAHIVGYPIDIALLDRIKANITAMSWVLKQEANVIARLYDDRGVFKKEWLKEEAAKLGLEWRWLTESGKEIATDKKTLEAAVDECPALAPIADLILEIGNLKNFTADESPGGFHTPKNVPLQSATLRTQSSGLMYLVKWFRGLILVPPGFVIIHADFKAEELHIATVRSGDENLLQAVAGDPHLKLGIEAGLIPADGDAKTHHAERARAKIANFRILYGSGGKGLAKFLKCSEAQGWDVLDTHKRLYPKYWTWVRDYTREACARGFYETKDGFRISVPPWPLSSTNLRRMQNAPIQSMGAVIHRKGATFLHQRGQGVFEVCGSQHDSWDIIAPIDRAKEAEAILVECMRAASAWALDGYEIPVDQPKTYEPGERLLGDDEDITAAFQKTIALLERVENDPPADMPVKRKPVPRQYNPDWKQAERFLKFLFPEPEARFTLKVIDNSPAKTGAKHATRSITDTEKWLASNAREPWGAYISPHAMDGKGWSAEHVTGARCVMADLDGSPLSVLERFVLPPSAIIESSAGRFHVIWLCDDIALDMVKPTNAKLARVLGADAQFIDLARCIRLPGCFNFKRERPFRVKIHKMPRKRLIYTFAEISEALGGIEAPAPKKEKPAAANGSVELSYEECEKLRDALHRIPADDRAIWLKVGMALHSVGERALWDDWSAKSAKYDEAGQETAWNSFAARDDGITIASIFQLAKPPARGNGQDQTPWPDPKRLPDGMLPVDAFEPDFLPETIAPWCHDIAERMQCPLDFVGVAALTALGTALGRKIGMRPKQKSDWTVAANFWAIAIGPPGMLKSPAIEETLKPLRFLEKKAAEDYADKLVAFQQELELHEVSISAAKTRARKAKAGELRAAFECEIKRPEEPKQKRYLTNDTTYEKLGAILADNPQGALVYRDEMISLLRHLDREDQVNTRSFFMTAWNGHDGYTFDRIIRGTVHIEHACLSLLGAATPSGVSEYIAAVHKRETGGDGLIQRFGLAVWPDIRPEWVNIDEYPDSVARKTAWETFVRLDALRPNTVGAGEDEFHPGLPFLRFSPEAQTVFNDWYERLQIGLRTSDLPDALRSHFAKYGKLVPGIALIHHIAGGVSGPVSESAVSKAVRFARYLKTHARRIYASGIVSEVAAAKAILAHIRKGDLQDGFRAREVHQKNWANLADRQRVQSGLDLLCDYDWIVEEARRPGQGGGRPSTSYRINPEFRRF
jgi:putative DNA primase/helicase